MAQDDRIDPADTSFGRKDRAGSPARGAGFVFAALALTVITVTASTGFLMVHLLQKPEGDLGGGDNRTSSRAPDRPKPLPFNNWPEPAFVIMLSAQQDGHDQPCGCVKPQLGGLVRRYNFRQSLKKRGWEVVAVDLGDIAQQRAPRWLPNVQGLSKHLYSMMALEAMGYTAVGIGVSEMRLSLFQALGQYSLQYSKPRVLAANLIDKNTEFPGDPNAYADRKDSIVGDWQIESVKLGDKEIRVGIVGLVGPSVAEQVQNQGLRFADNTTVLPAVLKDLETNGKPDLRVLLHQGSMVRKDGKPPEVVACAQMFPEFQVVLCLSEEDEPSAQPKKVGNTLIIGVGHKGKYVGVVGVFRTGNAQQPFELRYELVPLGEEYQTPENEVKGHPIMELMERRTKEMKDQDYLRKYGKSTEPLLQIAHSEAAYVGSETCKRCHDHAYGIWEKSAHAHAFQTLVDAKRPSNRQYDAECIICHTVDFGRKSGYTDERPLLLKGEKKIADLRNVGCESCHPPGSRHADNPHDKVMQAEMNPYRPQPGETEAKRVLRIGGFCMNCHDTNNAPGFDFGACWPKVDHSAVPLVLPTATSK